MISPLLGSFSVPFFAWWLFFVLSPPQTGGAPSEQGHPTDDSISRQAQEPGETILYFPDYVDGGGWSVQLVISNVDPEAAAEVVVDVYDPEGQPVRDLFDSVLTLEIPALGSRVLKSSGSGTIRRGWIQVQTGTAAVSGLLTYRHDQSGIEVGVKPVALGQQFALFVEESQSVGAGVAVYKTDAAARLELRIRNEEGHDPMEGGVVRRGDFRQAARTLPEWFAGEGVDTEFLEDFRGLLFLETEDDSRFAPLGLRFGKRTSSLSAVPAIRTQSEEPQEMSRVFPDYVDGGGWSVQLVLTNVDPAAETEVVVDVYDPEGQPVLDLFDSDLTLEIPALGSRVLRSTGSGAIRRGWIQVEADAATISGLLTYRHAQSGIEVGVEPAQLGKQFALFVEESGTVGAGLAILKPDTESRIELRLRDEEGDDPLEGVFLPWRDFHQAARTLPEWFDVPGVDTGFLTDFRGLLFLRTEDDSRFAPLGLRFGKGTSSLSAVPAIRITEGGGIDGGHPPPPAVTLSASPKSIDRGQSTTLSWSSTSAESAEIEPDIGEVPTSGTRRVSPNVTTTYRITVTGADGQTATAAVTVTVAVSARVALGALFDALGGSDWTHSENWLTAAPLEEWYGVEVDSQGRVIGLRMADLVETEDGGREKIGNGLTGVIPPELGSLPHLRVLDLSHNQLTGPIPPELGSLVNLTWLDLSGNQLTGPIPPSLLQLEQLETFDFTRNAGLCAPGTIDFVVWLEGIERQEGPYCNESDVAGLESFYRNTGGEDWTNSSGWLGGVAVSEWYGVRSDSLGRVTRLDLSDNGLTGRLPRILGQLAQLTELRIDGNTLSGRLPLELTRLPLQEFHYAGTELCAPVEASFQAWLNAIPSHDGTEKDCSPLTDRDILVALYEATNGPNWVDSENWLTDAPLRDWYGVFTDADGRAVRLDLSRRVDPEALQWVRHGLSGPIPPELGNLSRLQQLDLSWNDLSGPIPPELGSLTVLGWLRLHNNGLSGPIPPKLGNLSYLKELTLDNNELTGPVPPELGELSDLERLSLSNNAALSGALPTDLSDLRRIEILIAWGTDLCAPQDPAFLTWFEGIHTRRIPPCASPGRSMAYLTQAVQSREYPVPLVVGEKALLRVFVTAGNATTAGIPPVRARFYLNGTETYTTDIPAKTTPIPTEMVEGNLFESANAEVPGEIVQAGLEMVIEIDPDSTLDPDLGVAKRIPETGRIAVDVREMPVFDLTVIPFLWSTDPDSLVVEAAEGMAADPEGHELLWETRTLLPVGGLEVTAHAPILSSSNNKYELLSETMAIRAMEGGTGHYMAMMSGGNRRGGVAARPGRVSYSDPESGLMAHELGHNLSLHHPSSDPSFPYYSQQGGGLIGAWGYDFHGVGRLVPPHYWDIMTLTGDRSWISDYHFTNALRYRLFDEGQSQMAARSLLLWGGVNGVGAPFLEPVFVVDAPTALPDSTGAHQITGRTARGEELFSLSFAMPEVADGNRRSSFAFVLPAQPGWAGNLATITLSGPGGSDTLNEETDRPVTILRNSRTGQIRGILRGAAATPNLDITVSALSLDPGLERLTSRGIPGPDDWTQ